MCPDQQLLSIYLDGELPSPWKEKIQAHFEQCSKCKEKLENFKKLQVLFKKDCAASESELPTDQNTGQASIEQMSIEAKERVWNKIEARRRFLPRPGLMRYRLSIPLPAAAAAAVVVIILGTVLFMGQGLRGKETSENINFNIAAEMDRIDEIPVMIPASDMSGIFQHIAPEGTNIIIFQLPENQNFLRAGEPAIIRAADFSQNNASGNRRHGGGTGNRRDRSLRDETQRTIHQGDDVK